MVKVFKLFMYSLWLSICVLSVSLVVEVLSVLVRFRLDLWLVRLKMSGMFSLMCLLV